MTNSNAVDLIESQESWYFSFDFRNHKDYLYKKLCGMQHRHTGAEMVCKSIELKSPADARSLMQQQVPLRQLKQPVNVIDFNPAKILQEHASVLDCLHALNPIEWRVVFRVNHTHRLIFPANEKHLHNRFAYYSILVKLRLKDQRDVIEVGEGSVHQLKFNQDGLCSRLKKITANHRESGNHASAIRSGIKVPVILSAGDGAIVFHELLGHSLEADYVYRNESPFGVEDIGRKIVSDNVTLTTRHGNDAFFKNVLSDDEGRTAPSPVLIENGVLRQLISDTYFQEKMGLEHAGHCRLEDFTRPPMPRNYSLYLEPGRFHPEELIASTDYGVYAGEFGEGKVVFHKDIFYFNIRDARLIEKGKLSAPLGSIVVQGTISEVLNSVEMVADDFRFDKGSSYCFKNGQTVNVRVGQPTVKIGNLMIISGAAGSGVAG